MTHCTMKPLLERLEELSNGGRKKLTRKDIGDPASKILRGATGYVNRSGLKADGFDRSNDLRIRHRLYPLIKHLTCCAWKPLDPDP